MAGEEAKPRSDKLDTKGRFCRSIEEKGPGAHTTTTGRCRGGSGDEGRATRWVRCRGSGEVESVTVTRAGEDGQVPYMCAAAKACRAFKPPVKTKGPRRGVAGASSLVRRRQAAGLAPAGGEDEGAEVIDLSSSQSGFESSGGDGSPDSGNVSDEDASSDSGDDSGKVSSGEEARSDSGDDSGDAKANDLLHKKIKNIRDDVFQLGAEQDDIWEQMNILKGDRKFIGELAPAVEAAHDKIQSLQEAHQKMASELAEAVEDNKAMAARLASLEAKTASATEAAQNKPDP